MTRAAVNADELETFALALRRFNDQLGHSVHGLRSQFGRLSEAWLDEEHHRFAETFNQTVAMLERFSDEAEEQVPVLLRKVEHLRAYLNAR